MRLYDLQFEHRPWATFGDRAKLQTFNPLVRVPTLVLDGGDVLTDSDLILQYLDAQMPAERRLQPADEPDFHRSLGIIGLACGFSDKAVSLFYEKVLHKGAVSDAWVERCTAQLEGTLTALEASRAAVSTPYWFGARIGHADIAVACAIRHFSEAHQGMFSMTDYPALQAHAASLEAMPVFKEISQPFIPPS